MKREKNFFKDITLIASVSVLPAVLPRGTLLLLTTDSNLYMSNGEQWVIAGGNVGPLAIQVAQNTADIATLNTQTAGLAADISTLQGDVLSLQGSVATNTANIATLNTQVSANTLDISGLQTNVTALQGQVATNTSNITTLQGQVATNTTNIGTLQTNVATNTLDISNLQTSVATNTLDIGNLQTTKEDKSNKGISGGYCPLTVSATPVVPAVNLATATKTLNGSLYYPFYTRLGLTANWTPGTATGTINQWTVLNDTAYALNNLYGSGPKGATGITFWKAPRDAVVLFVFNMAFSCGAASNRFFTVQITPVVPANTPLPHQYNFGLDNYSGSYSFASSIIVPLKQGDQLQFNWSMAGITTISFQTDYTYWHISEMSFGITDSSL